MNSTRQFPSVQRSIGSARAQWIRRTRGAARCFAIACAAASVGRAQTVLPCNAGPANNGGGTAWAIFFDVTATAGDLKITTMTTANTGAANAAFTVEVFTRSGTALGGPVAAGPGSSLTGWTSLGIANATQGAVASAISLPIDIPDIVLTQGQLTGVAVRFTGAGPRYYGTGTPPYATYTDSNLTLVTGDGRSAPFTATGSFFTARELVGSVTWEPAGSQPVAYCTAGTSTNNCVPTISATGTPSISAASGFTLSVANVEGIKQGIFFYGVSGRVASPWGAGASFLCVKSPTQRMGTQSSGGTLNACDGAFNQDWLAYITANPTAVGAPFSAGTVVEAQAWYRDPPSPKTTNLSDALEFTTVP